MPTPPLAASLIVVTRERADSLARTLTSLRQLRYPAFEVIVVAGPGADHTPQVLARHAQEVRAYAVDVANIAIARNVGLMQAQGEVVVFLDDDAVPEPDWLNALLAPYADRQVQAVGGFIRDACGFDFQARYVVADRYGDVRHFAGALDFALEGEAFLSLTGTNFSARRETLLKLGGFDETYVWFLDETDVNLRMHDLGMRVAVAEAAEVHHKSEAGLTRTQTNIPRTMYPQMRSKAYFCVRHNLGRRPLADILGYVADYVGKERAWKNGLAGADRATVERLIDEVERGAEAGVAEALRRPALAARAPSAERDAFKRFPLKRASGERLRLCLLTREYPPVGIGGVGQWTREVAVGLAARGHEVTVIALALDGAKRIDFVEGVWVHRVEVTPISAEEAEDFAPAPASLAAASLALHREAERIDARRCFDLISAPIVDLAAMASLRRATIPVVLSLHTTYQLSLPFKPDWLSRPDYLETHVHPAIAAEGRLMVEARHLLANSHAILADIEAAHRLTLDRAKATVIAHGIADLAREAGTPEASDEITLLFVGRLEPRKGADVLLEILPGILEAAPSLVAHFVGEDDIVVGDAPLRSRFEAAHPGARVRFHGAVSREALLAHYAAADMFVAPSQYESFGLVFVEAMCFGKPVVAFDVGGASEIIVDGETGLLAPPGDAAALADCVLRLAGDAELRARLGRAARADYERRFASALMLDRLEAFYRSVVEGRVASEAAA